MAKHLDTEITDTPLTITRRAAKADDLDLRPIHHYLSDRVRSHVLICMLAAT